MRRPFGLILAFLASLASVGNAAKVLVVFAFPGKSHSILGEGHVRALSEAGHEVTYVTTFKLSQNYKNTRVIDLSSIVDEYEKEASSRLSIEAILNKEVDISTGGLVSVMTTLGDQAFTHKNFQKILNDPSETFDVIISEWTFITIFAGLQAVYDCPYIWFSPTEPHSAALSIIDEKLNPAYTADVFSFETPPFSFLVRAWELFRMFFNSALREYYITPAEEKTYKEVLIPIIKKRGYKVSALNTLVFNSSLMLGNSHVSLGQPVRLPQNYKPIAGFHIDVNIQPLPQDLNKIMDAAKNGAIYFSMGSNLKSKDLPIQLKTDLVKLFGGLKYTLIWKFEEDFPDLPDNIHILKWAPQPSILAHPNCKLFITHGGLLSTTEAVHFGVPIIGIPVFADQFINIKRAENKGFGIKVDLSYSLVEDLKLAIHEIFATTKYFDKMKELSYIFHDRPVPPQKELVHWVEHVMKTGGAPHLRSPALDVPWYQKMFLDLAVVLIAGLTMLVYSIKRLCSALCSKKKLSSKKNN